MKNKTKKRKSKLKTLTKEINLHDIMEVYGAFQQDIDSAVDEAMEKFIVENKIDRDKIANFGNSIKLKLEITVNK